MEDQAETRAWLLEALEAAFPSEHVAVAGSLAEAAEILAAEAGQIARLHLAVIDLGLPDGSGISLIADLTERAPHVRTVVATVHDDDEHLFDAIAAGAQGYLLKSHDRTGLVHRLRRIDDGEPPLSPSVARRIMAHFRSPAEAQAPLRDEANLTAREQEVLALLARGARVAETARALGLTEHTVATYVKLIYRKLRISSRAEAALAAARRGLV